MSLGLAALALIERATSDYGQVSNPNVIVARRNTLPDDPRLTEGPYATYRNRSIRGTGAEIAAAKRAQTPLQRAYGVGLTVPESANDHH